MKLNPPLVRSRSRRLRKKLRIGEFRELGFSVSVDWGCAPTDGEQAAFLDALLDQVVELRGLAYGGGAEGGFVSCFGRGSATQADREAVSAWLATQQKIKAATVGPWQDCWHDGLAYALGSTDSGEPAQGIQGDASTNRTCTSAIEQL